MTHRTPDMTLGYRVTSRIDDKDENTHQQHQHEEHTHANDVVIKYPKKTGTLLLLVLLIS